MTIEDFARYFRRPPDELAADHVREYRAYLFRERKLCANTVNQRAGALRSFISVRATHLVVQRFHIAGGAGAVPEVATGGRAAV